MEEQKVDAWGKLVSLVQELPDIELIGEEMVTFGSSDKCTYVIKNQSISKFHCSFQLKKGQNSSAKIKDYSIHGTFVNGKRIGKGFSRPLFHTDEISFASIRDKSKPRPVACYILKLFSVLPREKSDESEIKKIYKIGRLLGTGKFAEVRMATDKQGKRYAMKIVDKQKFQEGETDDQQAQRDPAMDEMNILTKISHENIVGIHQVFNTENHIYLVLDLCTGGELLDKITAKGFYKENDAIVVMKQLFSALAYLHKMQFAHRDLKVFKLLEINL
ncbi:serine/threonine-protein kinase fhke-related [Anaeramoeba ignava]|uniref:Serine/threonine-protein kinase fhke-related n=1 Tax=Anaeramoeba ignava TaxID=1746090 RepID=A0A9Q0LE84_ANAIG|nr:serine/threonine-protein kinase fhke-related [Anaeramoeba ignava]